MPIGRSMQPYCLAESSQMRHIEDLELWDWNQIGYSWELFKSNNNQWNNSHLEIDMKSWHFSAIFQYGWTYNTKQILNEYLYYIWTFLHKIRAQKITKQADNLHKDWCTKLHHQNSCSFIFLSVSPLPTNNATLTPHSKIFGNFLKDLVKY